MSIRLTCSCCGKSIRAPEEFAGKLASCPACGEQVTVPAPSAEKYPVELPVASPEEKSRRNEASQTRAAARRSWMPFVQLALSAVLGVAGGVIGTLVAQSNMDSNSSEVPSAPNRTITVAEVQRLIDEANRQRTKDESGGHDERPVIDSNLADLKADILAISTRVSRNETSIQQQQKYLAESTRRQNEFQKKMGDDGAHSYRMRLMIETQVRKLAQNQGFSAVITKWVVGILAEYDPTGAIEPKADEVLRNAQSCIHGLDLIAEREKQHVGM